MRGYSKRFSCRNNILPAKKVIVPVVKTEKKNTTKNKQTNKQTKKPPKKPQKNNNNKKQTNKQKQKNKQKTTTTKKQNKKKTVTVLASREIKALMRLLFFLDFLRNRLMSTWDQRKTTLIGN